jgi:hypothetical protein
MELLNDIKSFYEENETWFGLLGFVFSVLGFLVTIGVVDIVRNWIKTFREESTGKKQSFFKWLSKNYRRLPRWAKKIVKAVEKVFGIEHKKRG